MSNISIGCAKLSSVCLINTCTTHAVDKSKAQLQADPKEEKELQVNLIQALEMLRPNDSMIAELKEKLLAQKPESSLTLTAPQQRRLQEILNGKIHMRIQLISLYYYVLYDTDIKPWYVSAAYDDATVQVDYLASKSQ